jgi:hypothetical protein
MHSVEKVQGELTVVLGGTYTLEVKRTHFSHLSLTVNMSLSLVLTMIELL